MASEGIGYVSLCCAIPLVYIFRRKFFGYMDPLSFYLLLRITPMLAAVISLLPFISLSDFYYIITASSVLIFISVLYLATPTMKYTSNEISKNGLIGLYRVALSLVALKLIILFSATGTLPIFGSSGSDSFINFEIENKIGASLLLALGTSELILISVLLPVVRGRKRLILAGCLILSALMILSVGKKSSLLMILFALVYGDYIRISFTNNKKKVFTNWLFVALLTLASFVWAGFLYWSTAVTISMPNSRLLTFILDIIFIQWAYPVLLFASGELDSFFDVYNVNRLTYFLHSALSPLGFPAFKASIGPALNEYQTGQMTGNGINPTFLLEGYVIVGVLLPLYSAFVALVIGRSRHYISKIRNQRDKIMMHVIITPALYILPVDALLFMKVLMVLLIFTPLLMVILRGIKT